MALENYTFVTLLESDAAGQNTVSGRSISVKIKETGALASIYEDEAGATAISQPGAVTDANGEFDFWALPGVYTVDDGVRQEIINLARDNKAVVVSETPGATYTPNAREGSFKDVEVSEALTIAAPTNTTTGQRLIFNIKQDSTGGYSVTWNSVFKFNAAWSDTGNTANASSMIEFIFDGTNWRQSGQQANYI